MQSSRDDIRIALAGDAYLTDLVRVVDRDLTGATHVIATRRGLFVSDGRTLGLVAHGLFYGITFHGGWLYAFEACDRPRSRTMRGRIVRLLLSESRIVRAEVIAKGLDNGCHQIDAIDDRLCVLDTYNQRVLSYSFDGEEREVLRPIAFALENDWAGGYAHANSLVSRGHDVLLMLHNGTGRPGVTSEIARLDAQWRLIERIPVPGRGCHNLAVLEDGSILACGSYAGEIVAIGGFRTRVCELMTRGLSVGTDVIAVGGSAFAERETRDAARGAVFFLDRTYREVARVDVPAPVMEIRRLDGLDRSLSAHLRRTGRAASHPLEIGTSAR